MKKTIILIFIIFLVGCVRTEYKYVPECPYGVGYITQSDYEILSDQDKISDTFADWLIATNEFCSQTKKDR